MRDIEDSEVFIRVVRYGTVVRSQHSIGGVLRVILTINKKNNQMFRDCQSKRLPTCAILEVCEEAKWTAVEFSNNLSQSSKLTGSSGNKILE